MSRRVILYATYKHTTPLILILTSAKRGTCERAVVQTVLAILSRHVLGQVRVLRDRVRVFAGEPERIIQTQGEGSLCRPKCIIVVGVQHGDAHLIESCAIVRRAYKAEGSEVLQGEIGRVCLRYKTSLVERAKQIQSRYV